MILNLLFERTTFIHFLRFSAAGIVALAHLRDVMFADYKAFSVPPLWFSGVAAVTGFAGDAVMVFFVISGWLVGGGLLKSYKTDNAYKEYAVARITRLWTVLLPLFLIQAGSHFRELFAFAGAYGIGTLGGNLVGLQTVYFDTYAGNFPLWSLANETAYYVVFVGLVAVFDARISPLGRFVCALAVVAYAMLLTAQIRIYFLVWLLGALAAQLSLKFSRQSNYFFAAIFILLVTYKRQHNLVNVIEYDIASSIPLVLLLVALPEFKGASFEPLFARLASFSFSLYVVHIPLISLFSFQDSDIMDLSTRHLLSFCFDFSILIIFAFIYAQLFEARYHAIRKWVRRRVIFSAATAKYPRPSN